MRNGETSSFCPEIWHAAWPCRRSLGARGSAGAETQRVVPESAAAMKQSFAPVVKKAAPAVVNVYVRHRVEQMVSPFFDDPFFGRLFGDRFGIPRERIQNSLGSGVMVSPDGVVVTNNHVIQGSGEAEITVALADGREFPAKVILKDEHSDLAVLRLQAKGVTFPSIEFSDSDSLEVGDLVLAIGDPFGVGQTVTSGIVSALARTQVGISDYQFFIQTDAAINPGNSGGALVDMDGRLVGINTAIFSKSGGSHGIGFAIPSNLVRLVVQSALQGGKVQRPWLGASLQTLTPDIADSLGLDRPAGALIAKVHAKGPAARAGLRAGDVVVSVDGKPVQDPQGFQYRFPTKGSAAAASSASCVRASRSRPPSPSFPRSKTRRGMRAISPAAIRLPAATSPICPLRSPKSSAWTTKEKGVVVLEVAPYARGAVRRSARRYRGRAQQREDDICRAAGAGVEPIAGRLAALGRARGKSLQHRHSGLRREQPQWFPCSRRPGSPIRRRALWPTVCGRPPCRGDRPGSSARRAGHAVPHGQGRPARLGDLLGTAGHRQDHGGAASCRRNRPPFRAVVGHPFRRAGPAQSVRRGEGAARARQGHAAVRRRDPSLQPLAAGCLPAVHGGRHHHSGWRHHGEPVLRAQFGAAVAVERAHLQASRRRGARGTARPRRGP